jgi:predicted lipoprotein with Yx(FWY)xxD motif
MRLTRHSPLLALPLLAVLALAACSGNGSNAGGIYGSSSSSTTSTTTSTTTTTTTSTTPGALPIATASVTTSSGAKTALVTGQGLALYYHTPDTATSVFTDASTWPPLLAGSGAPTSSTSLPGTLAVLNDANGAQVTYNGHPLYTFSGDTKADRATGDGLGGVWYVATPNLTKVNLASATPGPTPTPGSGYGYGH